ncbi:MAG: malate dehydrogenase [Dehalococcoidia bacterium]
MGTRKKVTIWGAGATGATMAQRLVEKNVADVVMVDVIEDMPQGKALDIAQSAAVLGFEASIVGTNDPADSADSDVVVVTTGVPRKPGMSREDLLSINAGIVRDVVGHAVKHSPDAVLILFANPMDVMCHVALEASGFPEQRVIGQGGMLDTSRFRHFIAQATGSSVRDVQAWVLGGHTEATMVPLTSNATVGGVPLTHLLPKEQIDALVQRARNGGAEIVSLLKTGSAFYAPSAATIAMVDAVILDQKRVMPCAAYLEGEFGITDAFVGVMAVLGAGGIERILQPQLSEEELAGMHKAAEAVKELVAIVQ